MSDNYTRPLSDLELEVINEVSQGDLESAEVAQMLLMRHPDAVCGLRLSGFRGHELAKWFATENIRSVENLYAQMQPHPRVG